MNDANADEASLPIQGVTPNQVAAHHIEIEGHPLIPLPLDQPIHYLGLRIRGHGDWSSQTKKSHSMVHLFTSTATKFKPKLSQVIYMFNVFFLPKLELAVRYVHGRASFIKDWVKGMDRALIGCIKHLCKAALKLKHSTIALCTGLILPSCCQSLRDVHSTQFA